MSSNSTDHQVAIDLAEKFVGKWKLTYGWIPLFAAFAAIFMAFLTGANNLPAPFSTPIGSGSLSLLKAFGISCMIYVPGAAFGSSTSTVNALFSYSLKENQPSESFLMWSLVVVLVTAAIWVSLATYLRLPVSSLQSIQGAMLGTILAIHGFGCIKLWNKNQNHNFIGGGFVWLVIKWTVAPFIAFLFAFLLFALMKGSLLRHENSEKRILVFLPIDYGISAGLLCLFIVFQVLLHKIALHNWLVIVAVSVATLIGAVLSMFVVVPLAMKKLKAVKNYKTMKRNMTQSATENGKCIESQDPAFNGTKSAEDEAQFEEDLKDFMQMRVLDTVYEEDDERSWASPDISIQEPENKLAKDESIIASQDQSNIDSKSSSFRKLPKSTPIQTAQSSHTRNFQKMEKTTRIGNALHFLKGSSKSIFSTRREHDRHTLAHHALAEKYDDVEDYFSFPHLTASCIFALIQSATEIAAVVSPYGAILDVFQHRKKYSGNGEHLGGWNVTWWFKAIGGLFVCGFRVTQSLGGKLTYMSNSRGLAAQLSTVAAIIIVTKIRLPVSTIHAFVGSLLGVGVADDPRLLFKFICGWVMTVLFCALVSYVIFSVSIHSPSLSLYLEFCLDYLLYRKFCLRCYYWFSAHL